MSARKGPGVAAGLPDQRDRHRPKTREELCVAVHEMATRGMSDRAIAEATHLHVAQIRRLLGERQ